MDGSQPLRTRRLTPADRPAVAELVRRVNPGDWLLDELDLLLSGPGPDGLRGYGGYGAELPGGRLAAVGLLDFTRPGEAYLGALRVAADMQNRGVGTRFTRDLLAEAARSGGRRAWMVSALDNAPMHRVAEKLGLARLGEWQVWIAPELAAPPAGGPPGGGRPAGEPPPTPGPPPAPGPPPLLMPVRRAGTPDAAAVAAWLRQHPPEAHAAPDYSVWDVTALEPADFEAWLAAGELALAEHPAPAGLPPAPASPGPGRIAGLMAAHWGTEDLPALRIRHLSGTAAAAGSLLAWAREQCRARPGARLGIGLPGKQAALADPWVRSTQHSFRGYAFMRPLDDLQPQ